MAGTRGLSGDTIITEVAAVCCYLADAFPAAKLNVNIAERDVLERLLSAVSHQLSAVDSILAFRRRGPISC